MKHIVKNLKGKNEPVSFDHSILGNCFSETDYGIYEAQTSEIPTELQLGLYPRAHNGICPIITNLVFSFSNDTNAPNKWAMFFDGSKTQDGVGIGCVLIDPIQGKTLISCRLEF
jgi:hypothetical protein